MADRIDQLEQAVHAQRRRTQGAHERFEHTAREHGPESSRARGAYDSYLAQFEMLTRLTSEFLLAEADQVIARAAQSVRDEDFLGEGRSRRTQRWA